MSVGVNHVRRVPYLGILKKPQFILVNEKFFSEIIEENQDLSRKINLGQKVKKN